VIIQPWLAVDPGQGCECLVAGETECAASIVILAADEDVGGLAMRGKFLARVSRLMLTMPGPRHDPPPGGPMALQLAGDDHRRRPDLLLRQPAEQDAAPASMEDFGHPGALGTIQRSWRRQRRRQSGHAVCAGGLERENTRRGLAAYSAAIVSALLFL
jgi:hypothetical protein